MNRIIQILAASVLIAASPQVQKPALAGSASTNEEHDTDTLEETAPIIVRFHSGYEELPQGKHQPWRLVRALQRLQDEIAVGKPRSLEAYRILLLRVSVWMEELDPSVWNHERNLDALAVYLLIGGKTELGYKALQTTKLEEWQKLTLEAALAYAERDAGAAYDRMLRIDHQALPPSISAQFALAKSMVSSSTDLELSAKYLQEARRLAPGTLIEEAALRRAIRISGETASFGEFVSMSKSYLHRFRKSHYFGDFLKNFSFSLVRMPQIKEEKSLELLKELMATADSRQQLTVAAYVARQAVVSGRHKLAGWASEAALKTAAPGSQFYTRMQLYSAATKIVHTEDAAYSLEILENMDSETFDKSDQKIHDAALSLGRQIMKENDPVQPLSLPSDGTGKASQTLASEAADSNPEILDNAIVSRAEAMLAELEQIQEGVFR